MNIEQWVELVMIQSQKGRKELETSTYVGGFIFCRGGKSFCASQPEYSSCQTGDGFERTFRKQNQALVLFQGNSLLLKFSEGCTQVQSVGGPPLHRAE